MMTCSLNGALTNGVCVCDKPWSGPECGTMNFKPVSFPQGYGMAPNLTTWGGNTIHDPTAGRWHMYVSAMTNGCPLSTWGHNSRIDHAVADVITGPYTFVDVAVPTWAHNAAPIALKDGSFAIVHIGTGEGPASGGQNCTHGNGGDGWAWDKMSPSSLERAAAAHELGGGSTIHVSKSLDGPWVPLLPNSLGHCNNPAPWVHANGTIFIVCGDAMKRAESISGPWTTVSTFTHAGGPPGNYEDPFLYVDDRGFHLIYHVYNTHENPPHGHECFNSTVAAHAFSEDGYVWHMSAVPPYGTQVELSDGSVITVATRERPKLYFDESGKKTHLFNGVCSAPACPDGPPTGCVDCKYNNWDYTLIQPLDV
jgi:hypothetical protein